MKNIITITALVLLLNACGDKKTEIKPEKVNITVDKTNVQTIKEINTTSENNKISIVCTLGDELVQGGGPEELLDNKKWTRGGEKGGLTLGDCEINTGMKRDCIQVDPDKPGTGMFQNITTKSGKRYRVEAELVGADNYRDKDNYDLGSSYVSIEDHKPVEKSIPIALSTYVKGNTPTEVKFDFDANKTSNYVSLRSDTAYRYPTVLKISVKELIVNKVNTDDNTSVEDNTTVIDFNTTVPCNL